ncbi:MAG: hypothetical protein LRZ85_01175 [Alphaproteobacteria bacterium]|nr:hypothetical protein [Alphaproteobacteria bacterium]MCD8519915.1 hypothetical protein [Alphaproteobacteria bacterium]MCD8526533.1 hypothetical protein [Alphaproteobacteria bacterium]MCD8570827.1 hypothetical protein [Alphaproteobacteria bacterium]
MSNNDKDAQAYFNLLAKAEVQLPDYPRGTGCYSRAQHAAKLMSHHGRDVELIWALGSINSFVPDIPNADWGNGMAFHVAVLDKQTGLVFDQAFCHEPVSRKRWENLFIPVREDGIRPRIITSGLDKYATMVHGEPELVEGTPENIRKGAEGLYLMTIRRYKPVTIDRVGNEPDYEA